jgi:hypothetical protein
MARVIYGYADHLGYFQYLTAALHGVPQKDVDERLHYVLREPAYLDRIGWPQIIRLLRSRRAFDLALRTVTKQLKLTSRAAMHHILREARRQFPLAERIYNHFSPWRRCITICRRYGGISRPSERRGEEAERDAGEERPPVHYSIT